MEKEQQKQNIPVVSGSKIDKLKSIKRASLNDFVEGKGLFWLMKRIIIEQDERISELEFKIANLHRKV